MVKWPGHNETVREDELWLFGYCIWMWPDAPYESRPESSYSDVTVQLNTRFQSLFGEYTASAVRRYIQMCRTDAKYRWHSSHNKRYNQFGEQIGSFSRVHASEYEGKPERSSDVPLYRKRMFPFCPHCVRRFIRLTAIV